MTGFDIGIGWQTRRGCGGSWSGWAFSFVTQEALGELTPNHYKMFQLTILGFYFRSYLIGPIADVRSETEECDGLTGDYIGREIINGFACTEKDQVIQTIYRAIKGLSREGTAQFIYCALEKFSRDVELHDEQMELWHGRKPN